MVEISQNTLQEVDEPTFWGKTSWTYRDHYILDKLHFLSEYFCIHRLIGGYYGFDPVTPRPPPPQCVEISLLPL